MRFKKCVIVSGVVMGIAGAAIGMMPKERTASAAVLVYDTKNVEEAIKTAITTADILTNAQKELALQVIDMTKMSTGQIENYLAGMVKEQNYPMDEKEGQTGALNTHSSVQSFWDSQFANLNSVLNGNMTVVDAYNASQKSMQALEKTNEDALSMAKTTQTVSDNV